MFYHLLLNLVLFLLLLGNRYAKLKKKKKIDLFSTNNNTIMNTIFVIQYLQNTKRA